MKKNWILRLGVLAMVLTLVTLPMVSSTYAKYVTTATGTATARVAKWGVTATVDATSLFGASYTTGSNAIVAWSQDKPAAATVSVNGQSATDMVFAPGTAGSLTFAIQGESEVAINLDVAATVTLSADWLANGAAYQPINFTLMNGTKWYDTTSSKFDATSAKYLTAAQLATAINSLKPAANLPANTDLVTGLTGYSDVANTGVYKIDWVWPFTWTSGTNLAWNAAMIASADVSAYYTAAGVKAVAPYNPATAYCSDSAFTVPVLHTTIVAAAYDAADTAIGKLATPPTLAITLTITATQIN